MAPSTLDHHFEGDQKLLHATVDRRAELRNALTALQKELSRIEGQPVQVCAEIKFNVSGFVAKEHRYSVKVTDANFDTTLFEQTQTTARRSGSGAAGSPSFANADESGRPSKRLRTDGDETNGRNGSISDDNNTSGKVDEILNIVKGWNQEWKAQGGWLFDTLNSIKKSEEASPATIDKKLDSVQDTLGQSINSACASTMSELTNITKLLPWLEHCRKTNSDKVQAREEKWRSSSATFHDQARREREEAEKRLEDKLEAQRQLLIKVAEANGIDIDEDEKQSEASLGEQLTAELNSEAMRAERVSRNLSSQAHITIDD